MEHAADTSAPGLSAITLDERLGAILRDATEPGTPSNIALMRLLIEAATEAEARHGLDRALALHESTADREAAGRLQAVRRLWDRHPGAWDVVRATIGAVSHQHRDTSPEGTLRYWASAFDRLATVAPEASVALYSLGSPDLLAEATAEIVRFITAENLISPHCDVLDLGCGIGRFARALASRVGSVLGLDVSGEMIAQARERCGSLSNVTLLQSDGRNLRPVGDSSRDFVLAADVFPYLVQAGPEIARLHVAEIGRVLRPSGRALILNYSYRGDLDRDRAELGDAAQHAGLAMTRNGTAEFSLWDGRAFVLRRPQSEAG